MGTPDSSYALATLAYEERLFGAIRIINSYKDRIPDFPKNGFSITTAKPGELDDSDASAGTNIYGIKFTPRKTVRENLNPSVKEGWCQPSRMDNPPIIACDAAHEYGHVIDLAITCQLYDKFYPEDAGKAFVSYKYEMLFGLVARVRAQKLKEATKLESGAKLKDTRILENDPKMVKGMSGYAHSQPAEFNAENLVRVTLSEKDSPDDILAIKTRAYLDQGLSGMAQDIEQTIKDEKLFEAHKSYYFKGFTGDLRTNAITPELLKQLDPKYGDLIVNAIRSHCKSDFENLRNVVADLEDPNLSVQFDMLKNDLMSATTAEELLSAMPPFLISKPYQDKNQHNVKQLDNRGRRES